MVDPGTVIFVVLLAGMIRAEIEGDEKAKAAIQCNLEKFLSAMNAQPKPRAQEGD